MNDSEINEAVHKGCGWSDCRPERKEVDCMWAPGHISKTIAEWRRGEDYGVGIPNYVEDLNACNAAEMTLTEAQYMKWGEYLTERIKELEEPTFDEIRSMTSANARSRSIALCRVFGAWKD